MFESEVFFQCPYCFETISMMLDPSAGGQSYIEDCEVCCRPIQVSYQVDEQSIVNVQADRSS